MSIALSELWTRLVRSGITDAAGCKQLAREFAAANSGTPPTDAESVARFMIKRRSLTRFQAAAIMATPPRELSAGNFLIRSDETPPPWSQWVEASQVNDGGRGMLLHVDLSSAPKGLLETLALHQQVQGETVQRFESEFHSSSVLVFSQLSNGRCLTQCLADQRTFSADEVCQLGIAIARSLAAIHASSLVHGCVRADRIWVNDDDSITLLRDPCASLAPSSSSKAAWLDQLESPALYAAPEGSAGGPALNAANDIYSLGCLLFRLASGRFPYVGHDDAQTRAAHQNETPAELMDAVKRGESGDPLFRVIAFAMAKSPAARFATAAQLADALEATRSLLTPDQTAEPKNTQPKSKKRVSTASPKRDAASSPKSATAAAKSSRAAAKSSGREPGDKKAKRQPSKSPASTRGESKRDSMVAGKSQGAGKSRDAAVASTQKRAPADVAKGENASPSKSRRPDRAAKTSGIASAPAANTGDSTGRKSGARTKTGASADRKASSKAPSLADPIAPVAATTAQPRTAVSPVAIDPAAEVGQANEADPGSSSGTRLRKRRKKKSKSPLILGGLLCVAVLMLLVGLIGRDPEEPSKPPSGASQVATYAPGPEQPTLEKSVEVAASSSSQDKVDATVGGYELEEDERLLFAPPYASNSPPPSLKLLPPGPDVIVTVRLSDVVADASGRAILDGFSPELSGLLKTACDRSGQAADKIERMTIALHSGKAGWPEASLVVELAEPVSAKDLEATLSVQGARTAEGANLFVGDQDGSDAFYWQASEEGTVSAYAVGSVPRVSEVAASEGGAIPLARQSQSLWNSASEESQLVILLNPSFLFADGRELIESTMPQLMSPLRRVLQPDVIASLITVNMQSEGQTYVEARFAPSGGISEAALMQKILTTLDRWPAWADQFLLETVPEPSWRLLAVRLPAMMDFVVSQARFGVSDGAAVANAYLPSNGLPQIVLATVWAANTPPQNAGAMTVVDAPVALTIEQILDRPMSVSFEQESLEFALNAIIDEFKRSLPKGTAMPEARIVGGDLQLMGITQNQQVRDFVKSDQPLRSVLTDLVVGANPDKSATGPSDPKQSLIWVVADRPGAQAGGSENTSDKLILITTRQAARDKYEVPREFEAQAAAE